MWIAITPPDIVCPRPVEGAGAKARRNGRGPIQDRADCRRFAGRLLRRARGFSLIDVVACTAIVTVALLGHAASVISHQNAAKDIGDRGLALMTLQRFVERMRQDTDWPGLYGRLLPRSVESAGDTGLAHLGADPSLPTYDPTTYYADFEVPESLGTVTVLVQVPMGDGIGTVTTYEPLNLLNLDVGTTTKSLLGTVTDLTANLKVDLQLISTTTRISTGAGLYEDTDAPRYGLPADLDGDGYIRGTSRATDYHVLPMVVRLRWKRPGRDSQEIVMATWLRGGW